MVNSFIYNVRNPNPEANQGSGQSGEAAVLFLITERDDKKNALELLITNNSDEALTMHTIYLKLGGVFPSCDALEVACPPGWSWYLTGDTISISSGVSLAARETVKVSITNIVFPSSGPDVVKPGLKYIGIVHRYYQLVVTSPFPVLLKPVTDQSCPLVTFEATFVGVPESEKWNVKDSTKGERLMQKRANTVFSNPTWSMNFINTRLAFSLVNQDEMDDLVFTMESAFEVSFLAGYTSRELARDLSAVRIRELFTQDWTISDPADGHGWILKPSRNITLKAGGGSYTFLVDSVYGNPNPSDNNGDPTITEMYVYYSNVPRRDGLGFYDDGYLSAKIQKIAPDW